MDLSWGSPVGLGAVLAGLGILFWGLSTASRKGKSSE